jgi:phosphopantothenoylcysteine synthetase/decarboxylase
MFSYICTFIAGAINFGVSVASNVDVTKSSAIPTLNSFIEETPSEIQHIALGDWADAIIVAPATANTIAKLSVG